MLNDTDIEGYFRAGVGACLVNARGEVLIMRRTDVPDAWQMPQGGIDAGETPEQALRREVSEEAGLDEADFDVIASTGWIGYELPRSAWKPKTGRGQTQKWFLCRVNDDVAIKPDQHEFNAFRWVDPGELIDLAANFRRDAYKAVIDSFALW